jgi:hypothetical protein
MDEKMDEIVSINIDKFIQDGIMKVKVNRIVSNLLNKDANIGEWNFEPVQGEENVRVYETREKKKILQAFFSQIDSLDIEEGNVYNKSYFDVMMKTAKKGLENYNKYEKEHGNEQREMRRKWKGNEDIEI